MRSTLHTIVISDIHLTEPEAVDPKRPLWKRFKQADLFVDGAFARLLEHLRGEIEGPAELVLNGDIFDFDAVMALPGEPQFPVRRLERWRGLSAEEPKSAFKMQVILDGHPVFVAALNQWLTAGHTVVFVIGNHDLELHWPDAQQALIEALGAEHQDRVTICEWFHISDGDTCIEHGNQYDSYCVCSNPIHPFIEQRGRFVVRIPFGNLAGKFMLNGMGLFNPYAEDSFIRSLREYVVFFVRDLRKIQPFILWAWLWSAIATLVVYLRQGMQPELKDPLSIDERVESIAERANATPRVVRALAALHAQPAYFSPWKIARELWLDRALLLSLVFYASFQAVAVYNIFSPISMWWVGVAFLMLLPPFLFYSGRVHTDVQEFLKLLNSRLPVIRDVVGVQRLVLGHTHVEEHVHKAGMEVLNTGTWSASYEDVACTRPQGRKCFAWIRPAGQGREAVLCEWQDPGVERIPEKVLNDPAPANRFERLRRLYGRLTTRSG